MTTLKDARLPAAERFRGAIAHPAVAEAVDPIQSGSRGWGIGLQARGTAELIRLIEEGFSFTSLQNLETQTGISLSLLGMLIGIPERTLARRKAAGRLTPEESERLLRISIVFEQSVELFEGDLAAAVNWLMTPRPALQDQQPLYYARTELGAREVENLMGRLEHGVFA